MSYPYWQSPNRLSQTSLWRGVIVVVLVLLGLPLFSFGSGRMPARGTFLVASEDLSDPRFREAVVLLVQHNAAGSVGLIVNKPVLEMPLLRLPDGSGADLEEIPFFYGGPVSPHLLGVLLRSAEPVADANEILPGLYLMSVLQFIQESPAGILPGEVRILSGYAGWAPGQLNHELGRGDWAVVPAKTSDVFVPPEQLWRRLSAKKGLLVLSDAPL